MSEGNINFQRIFHQKKIGQSRETVSQGSERSRSTDVFDLMCETKTK